MMFFIPPAVPPSGAMALVLIRTDTVSAECKKNSRDCFPGDLVGVSPQISPDRSTDLLGRTSGFLPGTETRTP
ncbi:hypothetical protein [Nodosilinea nodulosa]|uniref:hypothetical protein n=1 Tax=Nodosilinea nodulosa TaxID=416001 RepID=UPI0003660B78|nr:hypothetical protein [Nodosilinea nodulosa]